MGLVTHRGRKTHFPPLANDRGYVSGERGRHLPDYFYESHDHSSINSVEELGALFNLDPAERSRFYPEILKTRGLLLRRRK